VDSSVSQTSNGLCLSLLSCINEPQSVPTMPTTLRWNNQRPATIRWCNRASPGGGFPWESSGFG
jgi:hypothetical protein